MRHAIRKWCICALSAVTLLATAAGARAEESQSNDAGQPAPAVQTVAGEPNAPDLAARVAALEAALTTAADKAAADKRKAAGKPTVVVRGHVFADTLFFNQDADSRARLGDIQDATYFRTARIGVSGDAFEVFSYRFEADLAGRNTFAAASDVSVTSFKDVFIAVNELPLAGTVEIGHYKEPFSLEELIPQRFISFMERALPNALVPSRNMGIMAFNNYAEESGTWEIGVFREMTDIPPFRAHDDGGRAVTGRVTWLPWYDEAAEGRSLAHLGLGGSYRDDDDRIVRFRSRPEVGMMRASTATDPNVVDTGVIENVADWLVYGPELAWVYGPLSVQSEWVGTSVRRTGPNADAFFSGSYVYVSYFLTGEHRTYQRNRGVFDRVKPYENFFRVRDGDGKVCTGRGAWEFLYRYSTIDLEDPRAGVNGGTADDHTVGITWYWTPYAKLMFNYIHTTAARPAAGWTVPMDVFGMRMAMEY